MARDRCLNPFPQPFVRHKVYALILIWIRASVAAFIFPLESTDLVVVNCYLDRLLLAIWALCLRKLRRPLMGIFGMPLCPIPSFVAAFC